MNEYDLAEAFRRIENELMASMIRNMARHRVEEIGEGYQWSMWQAEMLKSLERYKRNNRRKYGKQFKSINSQIAALIREARAQGSMRQEIAILRAIQRGWKYPQIPENILQAMEGLEGADISQKIPRLLEMLLEGKTGKFTGEFLGLNDRKLDALIKATMQDMERAETAILRKANDDFRKAIFNAQVYANTGAGTYEQAVDMATKDMLSRGLNCVEYANGARHTLADYADMAIRTACKRAYLQGEGEMRKRWGIATVIMNKRGNPCPKCLPFCGKVLIDDVWSGGSPEDGPWPLMSRAVEAGLYHPRCRDSHTTYFPGITTADGSWTEEELEAIGQSSRQEARQQYAERQAAKFGRLAEYSLDPENRRKYGLKAAEWQDQLRLQRTNDRIKEKYNCDIERRLAEDGFYEISEDTYDSCIKKHRSSITEFERSHIYGFDWDNFRDMNPENGFFNSLNAAVINEYMRSGNARNLMEAKQKTVKILKDAIQNNTVSENMVAQRYVDLNWFSDKFSKAAADCLENGDFEGMIQEIKEFADHLTFSDNQFVSVSLREDNVYSERTVRMVLEIPKGTRMFVSENRMESEAVLYKPGYSFRGIRKSGEQIEILLKVTGDGFDK